MSEKQKKTDDKREVYLIGARLRHRDFPRKEGVWGKWQYESPEWLELPNLTPYEALAVRKQVESDASSFFKEWPGMNDVDVKVISEEDSMREGPIHFDRKASVTENASLADETDAPDCWKDSPQWYLWRGNLYATEILRAGKKGVNLAGEILKAGLQVDPHYENFFLAHALYRKKQWEDSKPGATKFGAAKLIDWFNGLSALERTEETYGEQGGPINFLRDRERLKGRVNELLKKAKKDCEEGNVPDDPSYRGLL